MVDRVIGFFFDKVENFWNFLMDELDNFTNSGLGKPQPNYAAYFDQTPHHVKRGWRRINSKRYEGYYRTRHKAVRGEVTIKGKDYFAYIWDPPAQLRKHPHWPCFDDDKKPKYSIHIIKQPAVGDIDSVIVYVERLIAESYEKY